MSIINYAEGFTATGQVTKMATFNSKGGGLMVQVQLPLEGELAANIAMHLGNIAEVTMKFSSVKKNAHSQPSDKEDEREGQQALDFIGDQAGGAPEEALEDEDEDEDDEAGEDGSEESGEGSGAEESAPTEEEQEEE